MKSLTAALIPLAILCSTVEAVAASRVDSWNGLAGLTFGEVPSEKADFPSAWQISERDRSGIFYKHHGKHPPFMGFPLKDLLVVTSKRHGVVVAFGMTLASEKDCQGVKAALERLWGPAFAIKRDEFEWQGVRVDVDLEMNGMGCFIWARDQRWDDTHDEFKR